VSGILSTNIEYLKGVGPMKADTLKKELGIFTFGDLLYHFPFRHIDRTTFHRIADIQEDGQAVQLRGVLMRCEVLGEGRRRRMTGVFRDETGAIELVWFTGVHYLEKVIERGKEYIVYGKPTFFNGKPQITHPEMEPMAEAAKAPLLQAVYPTTEKLKTKKLDSKGIGLLMKALFRDIHPHREHITDMLPDPLVAQYKLPNRYEALMRIHFPRNQQELDLAIKRLKFEELFLMQMRILQSRTNRHQVVRGYVFGTVGDYTKQFYAEKLPFELTNAQKRVLREIRQDMGSGKQMNRLLQGDVGSGKTIVALMTMLIGLDNGYQAALMAPTEILAQQHYNGISALVEGMDIRVELLTGSVTAAKRRKLLADLQSGDIHILIGTHALIEDPVQFKQFGMLVVDEQHRFGVEQRAKMWRKSGVCPPHVLVMSATPIPRTLAMTIYGDLDVSVIDELPPGRKPIVTMHKYDSNRLRVFGFMRDEIAKGRQVYVVYPLIEESGAETMADIKNLMEGFESIEREFPKPQYQLSIVHGQMKAADKEYEMQRFIRNETQIMVATTVIEVGVNVPNASVMVIENAERFGLAQLHQLRGRVGRGADESYCILMTGYKLSADGRERIDTMCRTQNGFEIADADMRLRGPGNIEGTQQSGLLQFKIADLVKDDKILRAARMSAEQLLEDDPKLEKPANEALGRFLKLSVGAKRWGRIS
jgi:ATP-dependent DNA helicase RecG